LRPLFIWADKWGERRVLLLLETWNQRVNGSLAIN